MGTEVITRCDEDGNPLGRETREEIHKRGYWHQTFHCWFVSHHKGKDWIHLQLRSDAKKDFPNLLDITAAGHLLADETVEDGVREVEEELGIPVKFEDLLPLGMIKDQIQLDHFIDNELCQVFLYRTKNHDVAYKLQKEEVSGIFAVDFQDFQDLCAGRLAEAAAYGFKVQPDGVKEAICKSVNLEAIVPHTQEYLKHVSSLIAEALSKFE